MVMQIHEMQSPYYSFTKGAWKFIVLDSAHENNGDTFPGLMKHNFNGWRMN